MPLETLPILYKPLPEKYQFSKSKSQRDSGEDNHVEKKNSFLSVSVHIAVNSFICLTWRVKCSGLTVNFDN